MCIAPFLLFLSFLSLVFIVLHFYYTGDSTNVFAIVSDQASLSRSRWCQNVLHSHLQSLSLCHRNVDRFCGDVILLMTIAIWCRFKLWVGQTVQHLVFGYKKTCDLWSASLISRYLHKFLVTFSCYCCLCGSWRALPAGQSCLKLLWIFWFPPI